MAEAEKSGLVRAVGATRGASPLPDLAAFESAVVKTATLAASELLAAEFEATRGRSGALSLKAALAERSDPCVYYWIDDDAGAPAALLVINPAFAAVLTVRLLGGDLSAPASGGALTTLAFDMAAALVDVMTPALNRAIGKISASAKRPTLQTKRGLRLKTDAARELEQEPVWGVSIDYAYGGSSAPGAIELLFLTSYIERLGLGGAGAAPRREPKVDADWPARLRRNVLACEIPLTVVLDRFSTSVGDLSRLSVGQIITIGEDALAALEIAAETDIGPVAIAQGRLGAVQTRKAVKLTTPIDPDFLKGL